MLLWMRMILLGVLTNGLIQLQLIHMLLCLLLYLGSAILEPVIDLVERHAKRVSIASLRGCTRLGLLSKM
jgi:hypothetical protein